MGTSKGYIAPTTPHWSKVKKSISAFTSSPNSGHISSVAGNYAKAALTDGYPGARLGTSFSKFLNFIAVQQSSGSSAALQSIGLNHLENKPIEVVIPELLNLFSNQNQTIDDNIALDCLAAIFENHEISALNDFDKISTREVFKELIIEYTIRKFAQMFEKQIRDKCPNIEEGNKRISEVQDYMFYTLIEKIDEEHIASIDINNLSNENMIIDECRKAYNLLLSYDEE